MRDGESSNVEAAAYLAREDGFRPVLRNIGATEEEIADLLREQQEDEAADRAEPLPGTTEVTPEFEPYLVGDRKCAECGARVLALPQCAECGADDGTCAF